MLALVRSFEHLVLQMLIGADYTYLAGNVVNNPVSYGVHAFIGAYPPVLYHHKGSTFVDPPFINQDLAYLWYYGGNQFNPTGSRAHEVCLCCVLRAVCAVDMKTLT